MVRGGRETQGLRNSGDDGRTDGNASNVRIDRPRRRRRRRRRRRLLRSAMLDPRKNGAAAACLRSETGA